MLREVLSLPSFLKEVPVKFIRKDGSAESCSLRELNGKERDTYFESMRARVDVKPDGAVSVKQYNGMQTDLLCLCLHHENDKLFTREEIDILPASTVNRLFTMAQRISALTEEESEKTKNA